MHGYDSGRADWADLAYNAANQITSAGFSYDGAGNLTNDPTRGVTNISYTLADQVESVVKDGQAWDYYYAGSSIFSVMVA